LEIGGSIPIHAYRAAAAPSAAPPAPRAPAPAAAPATAQARDLVAARVAVPIEFPTADVAPAAARSTHAFPLYTRAADAVEAAVGVRAGQMIDVRA